MVPKPAGCLLALLVLATGPMQATALFFNLGGGGGGGCCGAAPAAGEPGNTVTALLGYGLNKRFSLLVLLRFRDCFKCLHALYLKYYLFYALPTRLTLPLAKTRLHLLTTVRGKGADQRIAAQIFTEIHFSLLVILFSLHRFR